MRFSFKNFLKLSAIFLRPANFLETFWGFKSFLAADDFHDQGDAEWIVIRRSLGVHNDTPCGRPAPGRPIGRPGVGRPLGVIGVFSYYQLIIFISNIVPLIVKFTS
jgi:hypothetical protein